MLSSVEEQSKNINLHALLNESRNSDNLYRGYTVLNTENNVREVQVSNDFIAVLWTFHWGFLYQMKNQFSSIFYVASIGRSKGNNSAADWWLLNGQFKAWPWGVLIVEDLIARVKCRITLKELLFFRFNLCLTIMLDMFSSFTSKYFLTKIWIGNFNIKHTFRHYVAL